MSRVVVVKLSGGPNKKFSREDYRTLLEPGLKALSGKSSLAAAVRTFFPEGTVGMKTNCLTRKFNSTPVSLTEAISDVLEDAGWNANDIIVWERTSKELEGAGYQLNASSFGRRCFGTDARGVGYGRRFYSSGDVSSLVSGVLTGLVDFNLNLPVLKDHSIAGLSGGLKNMYGAINNPNKYHDNNCDPFAAHVSNLEPVKSRNRLTIMDSVRVQYNNGPGFSSDYLEYYGGLIISDDPVACDSVGLKVLERLRQANGLPSLEKAGRPVKYLKSAEKLGLGVADMNRIDLQVLAIDAAGRVQKGELF